MYSLSGRLNTIAFNTLIVLAALASLNFLSTYPWAGKDTRQPKILKPFKVKNFDNFLWDRYYNEDVLSFTFDFEADMTPLYNWNTNLVFAFITCEYATVKSKTNQVTIWDQRIPREGQHAWRQIKLQNEYPEYYLTDLNRALRDTDVTCYLNWDHMPVAGFNYGSRMEIGQFRTPKNFIKDSRRKYAPGPDSRENNY